MSSIIYLCVVFLDDRDLNFLRFYNNPSLLSFNALLSSQDALGNVCEFIKVILIEFSH